MRAIDHDCFFFFSVTDIPFFLNHYVCTWSLYMILHRSFFFLYE